MTEDVRNTWRHKGTCICWERLVYHSYYWFTIYSHTNHCRDVLSKVLCGQNEKGELIYSQMPRTQRESRPAIIEMLNSLHSVSYYVPFSILAIFNTLEILQFSINFSCLVDVTYTPTRSNVNSCVLCSTYFQGNLCPCILPSLPTSYPLLVQNWLFKCQTTFT